MDYHETTKKYHKSMISYPKADPDRYIRYLQQNIPDCRSLLDTILSEVLKP